MLDYINTPLFGVTISICAFVVGIYINKKTKMAILNPLAVSIIIIMSFLLFFDIDYDIYNKGGSIITFFLGPATVVLAVPLYKQKKLLKENWAIILIGITMGSLAGLFSILWMNKLFKMDDIMMISLLPKSTTAAISMEISDQIGGVPALTIAFTVVTGITGNMLGDYIFKTFKIEGKIAKGVALGTASHAMGTAKAMEMGEIEGALGSLAISAAGIIAVFLIPWFMKLMSI